MTRTRRSLDVIDNMSLSTPHDASELPRDVRQSFAMRDEIVLPAVPRAAERVSFPLIASAAPVVAAVVIWALTQSPFVLIFAALGPVVAVASMLDGRRQNARRARHDAERFSSEMRSVRGELASQHAAERAEAWDAFPGAIRNNFAQLRDSARNESEQIALWRHVGLGSITVGRGAVASEVRLDSSALAGVSMSETHAARARARDEIRELRNQARTVRDAPVRVQADGGIAIVGTPRLAHALMRGLIVQLARSSQPASVRLIVPIGSEWEWARSLPHATLSSGAQRGTANTAGPFSEVQLLERLRGRTNESVQPASQLGWPARNQAAPVLFAVVDSLELVPPECETVVRVDSPRSAFVVRSSEPSGHSHDGGTIIPELLGEEQARVISRELAHRAVQAGVVTTEQVLPSSVALDEIAGYGASSPGLACVIGVAAGGAMLLDLVAHGPHAVVGGTTGSGKSELLISWVISMAASHSPSEFAVLLVDFKGGAAFSGLEALPHCVGVLTDLDEREATRALASLRAELRAREQQLRAAHAKSIDDVAAPAGMPRLVIVVDEFAAMLNTFPELHELFVDIAARGRSLGVHLVLCTQRPAGVVRDTLLANCSLRVSLRVNNAADSRATMNTDAAALLSAALPGRALVATSDGSVTEFHSAVAHTARLVGEIGDRELLAQLSTPRPPLRRPWLPPLPHEIRLDSRELEGIDAEVPREFSRRDTRLVQFVMGLLDDPEQQRRLLARWFPEEQGPMLVLGAARTGRSTVLDALQQQAEINGVSVTRCSAAQPEKYWDVLVEIASAASHLDRPQLAIDTHTDSTRAPVPNAPLSRSRLILLDDWEAVFDRWPSDYQIAATDLLAQALRRGTTYGIHIVLAASGMNGAVQSVRSLWGASLLLRLSEKNEHVRAGGTAAHWSPAAAPGRGEWNGLEIQCALPTHAVAREGVPPGRKSIASGEAQQPLTLDDGLLLVISTRPAQILAMFRERFATSASDSQSCSILDLAEVPPGFPAAPGGAPASVLGTEATVIVGDPDSWQARWALFTMLRPQARLAFDSCRLSDFRALSRQRELPPLISAASPTRNPAEVWGWVVDAQGAVSRRRLV